MKKYIVLFLFLSSVVNVNVNAYEVFGGGAAGTLNGLPGSYYTDIRNQAGLLNTTGIINWDSSIGLVNQDTGVDEHGEGTASCEVTASLSDPTKIDIVGCHVHIQGPEYVFDAITSLDPGFAAGENSRFIGVTMNGYTSQTSKWTNLQKQTIIPLARLNAPLGQLGPGSDVRLVRDDRYFLTQNFYYDRIYHEEAVGAQYITGGVIFANATSGLIIGQTAGVLYDGQKKRHVLEAFENRSALFINLSSNEIDEVATKQPLTVDAVNYNPAGSNIVPLQNDNTFTIHTILKSPKGTNGSQEGGLFFVYGDTEYATAAGALAAISNRTAVPRFGLFVDQATSGLVAVALIIQQKNAVAVDTIVDIRPCQVCRP